MWFHPACFAGARVDGCEQRVQVYLKVCIINNAASRDVPSLCFVSRLSDLSKEIISWFQTDCTQEFVKSITAGKVIIICFAFRSPFYHLQCRLIRGGTTSTSRAHERTEVGSSLYGGLNMLTILVKLRFSGFGHCMEVEKLLLLLMRTWRIFF